MVRLLVTLILINRSFVPLWCVPLKFTEAGIVEATVIIPPLPVTPLSKNLVATLSQPLLLKLIAGPLALTPNGV